MKFHLNNKVRIHYKPNLKSIDSIAPFWHGKEGTIIGTPVPNWNWYVVKVIDDRKNSIELCLKEEEMNLVG
jgi:hypothetical protein